MFALGSIIRSDSTEGAQRTFDARDCGIRAEPTARAFDQVFASYEGYLSSPVSDCRIRGLRTVVQTQEAKQEIQWFINSRETHR